MGCPRWAPREGAMPLVAHLLDCSSRCVGDERQQGLAWKLWGQRSRGSMTRTHNKAGLTLHTTSNHFLQHHTPF